MNEYTFAGLKVYFPYEAYDCQKTFMTNVIKSLKTRENALLESPTGTGKTLCLLCSSLAWISAYKAMKQIVLRNSSTEVQSILTTTRLDESLSSVSDLNEGSSIFDVLIQDFVNDPMPKIIYVSRTHSQLSQVVNEFLNTIYKDTIKMCVLGSREQMCIEPSVSTIKSLPAQTMKCRQLVQTHRCKFYYNMGKVKHLNKYKLMDIEDLVKFGQVNHACPYYLSREAQTDADILFMPYNYLIDPTSRQAQQISIENAILIFDEAHNLESFCSETSSFEISLVDISNMISEVERVRSFSDRPEYMDVINEGDLKTIVSILTKFEKIVLDLKLNTSGDLVKNGDYLFQMLNEVGIDPQNSSTIISLCEQVIQVIHQISNFNSKTTLSIWVEALKTAFQNDSADAMNEFAENFKLYLRKADYNKSSKENRVLSFWCFNSGITMNALMKQGCRSIILTSGTLSPLESFASEMNIKFKNTLENPHVIKNDQVFVAVVPKGPGNCALSSAFKNRDVTSYQTDLGNALVNFCRIVPSGVLVFFPSYILLETCVKSWKEQKISGMKSVWDRISEFKKLYVEPREKNEFSSNIAEFYKTIDSNDTGAIFLAVCRGKASEGIDFSDTRSRAVVITGIPYPSFQDAKVKLKRQYLDEKLKKTSGSSISGDEWYSQQAARAVNQAIGRVIRHRNDWGAVLLCDERFKIHSNIENLPFWIRPHVKKFDTFGQCIGSLTQFVKHRKTIDELNVKSELKVSSKPNNQDEVMSSVNSVGYGLKLKDDIKSHKIEILDPKRFTSNVGVVAKNYNLKTLNSLSKDFLRNDITRKRLREENNQDYTTEIQAKENQPTKQEEAKILLSKIKEHLSQAEYREFQDQLRSYKAKDISIDKFLKDMEKIFNSKDRIQLYKDFFKYLPKKHLSYFEKSISEIEERLRSVEKKSISCCICNKKPPLNPFKSPCKHLGCYMCWIGMIAQGEKQCPKCQAEIKIRKLRKVFFMLNLED